MLNKGALVLYVVHICTILLVNGEVMRSLVRVGH